MLGILGLRYETSAVDVFPGREHETDAFRRISPMGTLPVLDDGGTILTSSLFILEHLAETRDPSGAWYPGHLRSEVEEWLGTAQLLSESAGAARLVVNFDYNDDLAGAQHEAHSLLREIDERLWFGEREGHNWLCAGEHPTIADIACFPDIVLCEEGGISRQDYPAVRRWLDRVKRIPGFTTMSGVFPTAPAL
jgi:glutathione S-transferase